REDGPLVAAELVSIVAGRLLSNQWCRAVRRRKAYRRQRCHGSGRQQLATGEFSHDSVLPFLKASEHQQRALAAFECELHRRCVFPHDGVHTIAWWGATRASHHGK